MGAVKQNDELSSALRLLVPISALSDEKFAELLVSTHVEEVAAGEVLFNESDIDPRAIYLLAGKIVMMSGKSIADTVIGGTESSHYPLAHHIPRQLKAVAKTAVSIIRIDPRLLDSLLTADGTSGETYEVSEILEEDENDWMTQLLQSEAFSNLPAENIQALFMYMEEHAVSAGIPVISVGEPGDYFYMVRSGRCKVVIEDKGQKKVVAELGPGDSFGEEALISDNPRNASVIMLTDGVLMRLGQKDFEELMKQPLIKWVTYDEATQLVDDGGVWLDVRMPNEHGHYSIEGSHNLPLSLLRSKAERLKPTRKYVTYCDNGKRSSVASFLLNQRGLDAYVLAGGFAKPKQEQEVKIEAPKEKQETDNVVTLRASQPVEAKNKDDAEIKAREAAELLAKEESKRREQVEGELAKLKQAQVDAKQMAEDETVKRLKAEAAVEKMKQDQELALRKAEEEIKKRKDVEADAARIKKEAAAAQIQAEKEVEKLKKEREQARQNAEAELAALRKQRQDAEKQAAEQQAALKEQTQAAQLKAKQQAEKLKQEADAARISAEQDAKRIREEASAKKKQVEEEVSRLQEQQKLAQEKAEAEAAKLKEEAVRVREEARVHSEKMASQIVAEAEQAKFEAEQQASQLIAEAESARLQAEAENATFLSSQEAARLKAEQEVTLLKAEAEAVRLHAEEEQQKMREVEADRLLAEQEANRIKSEAEAVRRDTEEEINRRQLEAESNRFKAEEEAACIKAEAESARFKAEEEAARLTAEVEKLRLDMQNENAESVAQLEAEAEAARLEAEEARRMRDEAETARLEAEKNAEAIKEETESAREQAVVDAQKIIDSAEETRVKAEDEAKLVKESAESARQQAEAEAQRLAEEARLAMQQAETDAQRLKEEAQQAQQRSDDVISRIKAEAEAIQKTADIAPVVSVAVKPETEAKKQQPINKETELSTQADEASEDLIITEIAGLDEEDDSGLIVLGGSVDSEDDFVVVPSGFVDDVEQDDITRLVNDAVDDVESVFSSQFTEHVVESQFVPEKQRNKTFIYAGVGVAVVIVIGVLVALFTDSETEVVAPIAKTPKPSVPVKVEPAPVQDVAPKVVVIKKPVKPVVVPEKLVAPIKIATVKPYKQRFVKDRMKSGGRASEMSILPAASYQMGSPSSSVEFSERPQHVVKFKGFAISRYEVTVKEYKRFLRATGLKRNASVIGKKDNVPVGSVDWDDANRYAKWLGKETGKTYRLPSEAEWEYAALANKTTIFPWGDDIAKNKANCFDCGSQWDSVGVAPVGSFAANAFGLYDIIGNVTEWTADCSNTSYKGAPTDGSAWLQGDCSARIVRGGAFNTPSGDIYLKHRQSFSIDSRLDSVGIRLVRDL